MSLLRQATQAATVKRATLVGGKKDQAAAATVLVDLACTIAIPLDGNQAMSMTQEPTIKSILAVFTVYVVAIQDIRQGDIVETGGVSYTVKAVAKWAVGRNPFTQVTMERINP